MKPESIKCILKSYLNKRQNSCYDDIDAGGFENPEYIAGEPIDSLESGANGLFFMHAQSPQLPLDELNAPLPPEEEMIAKAIGRQLSQLSDDFELDRTGVLQNQTSANGNRSVQFQKHIINVSPTCNLVQIPVIRTRAADGEVNVTWRTCDKSATAGFHYVESHGNISFSQGDTEKTIEVEIIKGRETNICFAVELFDDEGPFNTLMIYILDDSKFYPEEKQVVENIFNCGRDISVSEIVTRLRDNVTHNTFRAALQCLSSSADSVPRELALGAELLRLTMPHARIGLLTNVFCEFFSYLPELEDFSSFF